MFMSKSVTLIDGPLFVPLCLRRSQSCSFPCLSTRPANSNLHAGVLTSNPSISVIFIFFASSTFFLCSCLISLFSQGCLASKAGLICIWSFLSPYRVYQIIVPIDVSRVNRLQCTLLTFMIDRVSLWYVELISKSSLSGCVEETGPWFRMVPKQEHEWHRTP